MVKPEPISVRLIGKSFIGALSLALLASCATIIDRAPPEPEYPPTTGAFKLLEAVDAIPSEQLAEESPREDLIVRTMTGSPTPSEITSGESAELVISQGMRATLAGDAEGTEQWSVNNLVLFEVLVEGEVVDRFGIGFFEPLLMGSEMIEAVGEYSPRFDPKTPTITQRLPVDVPFMLRATALDYRSLGEVTSLWIIIEEIDDEPTYRELRDD